MNNQKKKNIRHLVILAALIMTSTLLGMIGGSKSHNLGVERNQYQITNTLNIDWIESSSKDTTSTLGFTNGKWMLNNSFEADPSRVHLLFAAIQQVSVRRSVSDNFKPTVDSLFSSSGMTVTFFESDIKVKEIETAGDERQGITYFREGEDYYIVEIPGYRTYIHGLVGINANTWKNMNLFHRLNWRNLARINVSYPENPEKNFSISRNGEMFGVDQIQQADTTKLFDYIDYVSLLNANAYQNNLPDSNLVVDLKIDVRDVGNRGFILEIMSNFSNSAVRVGRMDSSYYFTIDEARINPMFLGPDDFRK